MWSALCAEALLAVGLVLRTASGRASLVLTCKTWKLAIESSGDQLWRAITLHRFPHLEFIVSTVGASVSWRELYREQAQAYREQATGTREHSLELHYAYRNQHGKQTRIRSGNKMEDGWITMQQPRGVVHVVWTTTFYELREMISLLLGLLYATVHILYDGKEILYEKRLAYYGIKTGDLVTVEHEDILKDIRLKAYIPDSVFDHPRDWRHYEKRRRMVRTCSHRLRFKLSLSEEILRALIEHIEIYLFETSYFRGQSTCVAHGNYIAKDHHNAAWSMAQFQRRSMIPERRAKHKCDALLNKKGRIQYIADCIFEFKEKQRKALYRAFLLLAWGKSQLQNRAFQEPLLLPAILVDKIFQIHFDDSDFKEAEYQGLCQAISVLKVPLQNRATGRHLHVSASEINEICLSISNGQQPPLADQN